MRLAAFNGPSLKTNYRRKNLSKIFYASRIIAHFVPNFVAMATGVSRGKCIRWPIPENPPYRRKNLAKIFHASRNIAIFVPNFVAMATGVDRGKCNWQHSIAHPRKPPHMRKNLLRKPSYSPFCPKFRCHGNGGRSGKNAIGSI